MLLFLAPLLALPQSPDTARTTYDVDVYYDGSAVPHVIGESDAAALYGLGYQQMRDFPIGTLDRLWRYSGRFSELVGPSYLEEDYEMRLWDLDAIVARHKATMPADVLEMLEAYAAGIEAGRAWWRDGQAVPTSSARLRSLMGTTTDPDHVAMHIDPLPDYLNQGFHPFQFDPDDPSGTHPDYDPDDVPRYITWILDRFFDPARAITVDNVLSLGVAFSSGPAALLQARERIFVPDDAPFATNAWVLSSSTNGGKVATLNDPHTNRESLKNRAYFVHVQGSSYDLTGLCMPGFPVYAGYNDELSFAMSGSSDNQSVTRSTWRARLAPSAPLRFAYGYERRRGRAVELTGNASLEERPVRWERLEIVADTLDYFDVCASEDSDLSGGLSAAETVLGSVAVQRTYVPDPDGLGFPGDHYPVTAVNGIPTRDGRTAPAPGDTIEFEQASFTVAGSPYEFWLRLARTTNLSDPPAGEDSVEDVLRELPWGWDNNFLFARYDDELLYAYLAHVPVQGSGVAARVPALEFPRLGDGSIVLNGHAAAERWTGFHGYDDLPTIGPVVVSGPEVWISNTATPDLVEVGVDGADPSDDRIRASDLASYAPEILAPRSVTSWRQWWAAELMKQTTVAADDHLGLNEDYALDVVDPWMVRMWAFFVRARDVKAAELTAGDPDLAALPRVDDLIDWVEEHRHLTADGVTYDPAVDFDAHPLSLVTVYTTLLRSWYQDLLTLSGATGTAGSFGKSPDHPLFTLGTAALTRAAYGPTIDALWEAMVGTSLAHPGAIDLWDEGSGGDGLQNQDLLVQQWMLPAWTTEPLCASTQVGADPLFATNMDGTYVTRWGHVKLLCVTPHFFPPGRAIQLDPRPELFEGLLSTGLRPSQLTLLDPGNTDPILTRLKFPVYTAQTPVAFPMGGTEDSLFLSKSQGLFGRSLFPRASAQGLYLWNRTPDDYMYFLPHEQGAQALIAVELSNPPAATGRILTSSGATELTVPILPHQDRFTASAEFAAGIWTTVERDVATLIGSAIYSIDLDYTP